MEYCYFFENVMPSQQNSLDWISSTRKRDLTYQIFWKKMFKLKIPK